MAKITAVTDNRPSERKGLISEHGLSCLIQRENRRLLFDCGAGNRVWRNARQPRTPTVSATGSFPSSPT